MAPSARTLGISALAGFMTLAAAFTAVGPNEGRAEQQQPVVEATAEIAPAAMPAPIEAVSPQEAYPMSQGAVLFMNGGDLLRENVSFVQEKMGIFKDETGIEIIEYPVSGGQSFMCYNQQACMPLDSQNMVDILGRLQLFAENYGLEPLRPQDLAMANE